MPTCLSYASHDTNGLTRERARPMSWQYRVAALAGRVLLRRDDVDDAASATSSELNRTSRQSEQGVVTTASNVAARVEVCAALADDDLARVDDLATEALHAQTL